SIGAEGERGRCGQCAVVERQAARRRAAGGGAEVAVAADRQRGVLHAGGAAIGVGAAESEHVAAQDVDAAAWSAQRSIDSEAAAGAAGVEVDAGPGEGQSAAVSGT